MAEETILLAAVSILRQAALDRIMRVRSEMTDLSTLSAEERVSVLQGVANDLGIAAAASKAADGIDDVLREMAAASIREEAP